MTEQLIRNSLSLIDRETWKPARNRDGGIRVKSERWAAEINGKTAYDAEALATYLAAVSPDNIALLLAEIDILRARIASNGYDDDIWHNIVRLHANRTPQNNDHDIEF